MNKNNKKFQCPCCRNYTMDEEPTDTYEICPVCFWEDDPIQFKNHDYEGGANRITLNEARRNYKCFGAKDKRFLCHVRPPNPDEIVKPE